MSRSFWVGLAVVVLVASWSKLAQSAIYSPTQTELNSVVFTDFWPGNGATLDSTALVGSDGVKYTFDTGYAMPTPDAFSRTQFEAPFTQDLSSFDAFNIDFLANSSANPLQAQIYLRFGSGGFASNGGGVNINTATRTTASIPIGAIPAAMRNQITAFGIEIFSQNLFDPEVDAMASAFTSLQPPTFDEYTIFGFEGTGSGSLDGWGAAFQPDHTAHVVTTTGATEGTHALDITRVRTGQVFPNAGTAFRWGSQGSLNSNSGASPNGDYNNDGTVNAADYTRWRDNLGSTTANLPNDPTPTIVDQTDFTTWRNNFGQTGGGQNPAVQARIEEIVNTINNGDQLAMDVSFTNVDQFPLDQPGFLGYHMAITDGSGGFWQCDTLGFPAVPAVGESYEGLSLTVPLSDFTDRSPNAFGNLSTGVLTAANGQFNMILATNTGVGGDPDVSQFTINIQLDNIRIRTIVPADSGGLAAGAVPEPSTALLLASLLALVGVTRRR
jgi:hypothetical protein